jgi:hypothetical protein
MKRILAFLLLTLACKNEPAVVDTADTREPIEIRYVSSPTVDVHARADDKSPVLASYQTGESIPVLSRKGEWTEVRTGERAGWVHSPDLTDAAGKQAQEENPQPRFRVMPVPVSAPSAHGEIYIEADVNSDGDVIGTTLIVNSTGSDVLAQQNSDALKSAKFYPILIHGKRQKFKYYHKVTY